MQGVMQGLDGISSMDELPEVSDYFFIQ